MKSKYGDALLLKILKTDSPEAAPYRFRSATNVLFEKELVPIDIATDQEAMSDFLAARL